MICSTAALGEVVTVSIGPEKKLYHIHKDLICYHSEYFGAADNGRWKEAGEEAMLEDVNSEAFSLFVHWLYTQQLPNNDYDIRLVAGAELAGRSDQGSDAQTVLIKAYVFADRMLAHQFKRSVRNLFVDMTWTCSPWYRHVICAFENIKEDDPILDYIVDLHCMRWSPKSDLGYPDEMSLQPQLPQPFLLRVMMRMQGLRDIDPKGEEIKEKACSYHEHDSDDREKTCAIYTKTEDD
jgi:hypothetical protein